jgi:hypothetical protein
MADAGALDSHYPEIPVGPRLEAALGVAYRARRPVLIEGPTGIGKSEVVHQLARSHGIASSVLDLSLLEPPDLVGLPMIADGRTRYATPSALPRDGAGILMLEELNRAERYIQQPALQLLTARRLHEYELPPDWVCFAAINPEGSDYHVTPLDRALRVRFLTLRVRADRAAWLGWAREHDVHPAIIALAQSHDRIFDDVSPRSWTFASQVLRSLGPGELADETLLRDALGGYLPPSWCELLLATRSTWSSSLPLDVRVLLSRYESDGESARVLRGFRDRGETDRIDEIVHRVMGVVRGPEMASWLAQKQFSLESFEALLADLPGDQRERLQDALANNESARSLLEVQPGELLQSYANSRAEQKVKSWCGDPLRRHRLAMTIAALRRYLEQSSRNAELRRSNAARIGLGILLAQLPERQALPLVDTLIKLGITPVKPG